MFVDILPNLMGPVLVLATLYIPTAIIVEATLSFLGIGIPEGRAPSWGSILSRKRRTTTRSPGGVVYPAAALLITTLAFNLLGDGIRDAMDFQDLESGFPRRARPASAPGASARPPPTPPA